MAAHHRQTLTAGPLTIPGVSAAFGALFADEQRAGLPGQGVAVELPAVLELLAAIERKEITADQAREAFGPILEAATRYDPQSDAVL